MVSITEVRVVVKETLFLCLVYLTPLIPLSSKERGKQRKRGFAPS